MRVKLGQASFPKTSFPSERSKAVHLVQFVLVFASVISYVAFWGPYFFQISPSFGASEGLYFKFVILAFHQYFQQYVNNVSTKVAIMVL